MAFLDYHVLHKMRRGSETFWDFSLRFYSRKKVAEACLALQEEHGADVNLILLIAWAAQRRTILDTPHLRRLIKATARWQRDIILRLRTVRRALSAASGGESTAHRTKFREAVKVLELRAEQIEQITLESVLSDLRIVDSAPSPRAAASAGLSAYERVLKRSFPLSAVDTLTEALQGSARGR
jgi:uncharacterized protein (TIGR02444 family)